MGGGDKKQQKCLKQIETIGIPWGSQLSKPQLNHNSTQPNITLSWVRHENDFANHPTPPQKLNGSLQEK